MRVAEQPTDSRNNQASDKRHSVLWIILMLCFGACVEPYFPSIVKQDFGVLVVDGFLVGNDSTKIKLSRTRSLDSPVTSMSESNAHVEVQGEQGDTFILTEQPGGSYVAPMLPLDRNQKYRLRIVTQSDQEYQSEFVEWKQSALLDSITKTELAEHDQIGFYIYAHDPENKARYYYWTYDETWKYTSLDYSVYYFENDQILPRQSSSEIYECYRTVFNNNYFLNSTAGLSQDVVYRFPLIEFPQFLRKFYYGYSLLVRQYALTEEAYSYYAITKRNSENLGTLFDPIPSQPQGNFRCVTNPATPVIGFFSASTVQKNRIFFTRQEIKGPTTSFRIGETYSPTGYDNCVGAFFTLDQMTAENLQGMLINDRVFDRVTFELIGYGVASEECIDCRMKGGTTTRPDYWR